MDQKVKKLPHDLLAEKSLLSCLILDQNVFDEMSDLRLEGKDFFHPKYGVIYEGIREMANDRLPIDYITICSYLKDHGRLDEVDGESFILDIVEDQISSANVVYYGKVVKEKSTLREIIRNARRVVEMGMSYVGNSEDFVEEVEKSFFKLTNDAKNGRMELLRDCLKANLEELNDTSKKAGDIQGLPTGYATLDEILLGMRPGQLIILAARPAMGKTAFALNIAQNACSFSQLPVIFFSLEMTSDDLSMRLLTQKAKVDSKRIRKKDLMDTDLRSIGLAVQELSNLPIYINDNAGVNLLEIQSSCRKIKAEEGLGLIIIDYLQLMSSHNKSLPREQQIAEISRGLKLMAKELECPVIALSQLNRSVESRPNKRPNTADLRESGAIEQDADIVMFVYRDEYYYEDTKEPGIAEIIIGKNRSGSAGTSKLTFVGAHTSFENTSFAINEESRF